MINPNKSNPPRWPDWILKRLCSPYYLEEIRGDLHEAFEDRLEKHKPAIAKLLYVIDTFGFLRFSLMKRLFKSNNINHGDLLFNHFKIALRIFSKNRLFSLINIAGLTIGISAYLLIIQYIKFESGYDKNHPDIDDLYRVTMTWNLGGNGFVTAATNFPGVAITMHTDFPEVENYARIVDKTAIWGTFILSHTKESGVVVKSNTSDDKMYIADGSIFDLFDIPFIRGNPDTALKDPMSMILSASVARRFFGDEDPLNKSLIVNNQQPIKITGVFEDLPQNTHLNFDILVSFSTLGNGLDNTWGWPEFYNYVKLKPGTDTKELEAKLPVFVKKYASKMMDEQGFEIKLGLQPVKDIHLKSHFGKELSANNSDQTLYFLITIAGFVIIIALINFINLSTAKSVERAREVGLRKIAGSRRSTLIGQFLMESLMINFVGIVLAVVLVSLSMSYFNNLVGLNILSASLWTELDTWFTLLAIFLSGGFLAGIYPALVLSSFKPINIMKGRFLQTGSGVLLRKILVITQFTVSIALITGTVILYSQFSFMKNKELGYDAEHSLIVNAPQVVDSTITSEIEVFKNELLQIPAINTATITNAIPGKPMLWANTVRKFNETKEQSVGSSQLTIDHDFLITYGISLLAGRNFTPDDRTSFGQGEEEVLHRIMVNKSLAKILGYLDIQEIVNEKIVFSLFNKERTGEVIGVTDNYHQQSLKGDFNPIMFLYPDYYSGTYLTLNINTTNIKETIEAVEKQFNDFFPQDPYDYFFLDEYFNRQYQSDFKFGQICLLFAGLAIFIAALGLFGLGSFMALQKTKEMGIRKVLGATTTQMLMLIPKNLIILVFISGLIALPITYFAAEKWISRYVFKIDIGLWMLLLPLIIVAMVATMAVLFQSLKAALVNPADSLRSE